jgi:hypothetical protein
MDRGQACVRRFDGSWPADDVGAPITCTREQWSFALDAVRRWTDVAERVGQSRDAADDRRSAELIAQALEV